jgi:hypothetical protein
MTTGTYPLTSTSTFNIDGYEVSVRTHGLGRANVHWPASNEFYAELDAVVLKSLRGMQSFVGICGGGTQVLVLLGLLQNGNNLDQPITLVDKNRSQFENLTVLLKILAQVKNREGWHEIVNTHIDATFASQALGPLLRDEKPDAGQKIPPRRILPQFHSNMSIETIEMDILEHVSSLSMDKKYFLYLSNLPSLIDITQIEKSICDDQHILNGSIVMYAKPAGGMALYEKIDGKLEAIYTTPLQQPLSLW